jgi:cation transport ATPase
VDGEDRAEVLRLAGAVEDASEHPVARAIAAAARDEAGERLRATLAARQTADRGVVFASRAWLVTARR